MKLKAANQSAVSDKLGVIVKVSAMFGWVHPFENVLSVTSRLSEKLITHNDSINQIVVLTLQSHTL